EGAIILKPRAAEGPARPGRGPAQPYEQLGRTLGAPDSARIAAPATREEKAALLKLAPADIHTSQLAGDAIQQMLVNAPGNGAAIGGLKVITANGWFAARPSGTEDIYKLYAESFRGQEHLQRIQTEARALIDTALKRALSSR